MSKIIKLADSLKEEAEKLLEQADLSDKVSELESALANVVRKIRYSLRDTESAIRYVENDGFLPIGLIRYEERRDLLLELLEEFNWYDEFKKEFNKQEGEENE